MEELIIKERELRQKLVELINECKLPAMIVKPILKELLEQVTLLEQSQYEEAQKIIKEKKDKKEE